MSSASSDVFEVLRTTRSVRKRLDFERPVEREVLLECIDAAVQAPTGLNREAWRFVVITDPEPKRRIAALYQRAFDGLSDEWESLVPPELRDQEPLAERPTYRALANRLAEMPALILVCSLGEPGQGAALQVGFYGSVLPAAWSLMLALRAKGLGATWTSLLAREQKQVAELLAIPDGVTQTVLLPVAYTRDVRLRPAERRPAHEVTYWNTWGDAAADDA